MGAHGRYLKGPEQRVARSRRLCSTGTPCNPAWSPGHSGQYVGAGREFEDVLMFFWKITFHFILQVVFSPFRRGSIRSGSFFRRGQSRAPLWLTSFDEESRQFWIPK